MTFRTVARRGFNNFHKKSYQQIVLDTAPFAYWPLSETTGTQATDIVGGFHGTYNNVTLGAVNFPDGTLAPLFDANNERISLPAASLDTLFDPTKGSLAYWVRVRASSVWTDGVSRIPVEFGVDANNRIFNAKSSVNNRFDWSYIAGGTSELSIVTSFNPTTWFHIVITWDKTADQVKAYLNGSQNNVTLTTLGTWSGTLATGFTAIGNFSSAGGPNFWDGYIKHVAVYNKVLSTGEIAALAPARFLV